MLDNVRIRASVHEAFSMHREGGQIGFARLDGLQNWPCTFPSI